ncbi:MAG: hypothetical protein AAGI25_18805 [Bacteroidota bacterium]
MKITKELLERYGKGLCTEEEKKAIERWFEMIENPTKSDRVALNKNINKERVWSQLSQAVPELLVGSGNTQNIPMYRKLTRYAAAACIIFAAFFGGRFSAGTASANPVVDTSSKDHLYVLGANGAEGYLFGDHFEVEFNGIIRLYNGSIGHKIIHVGDTALVLESYKTYDLVGNNDNPLLSKSKYFFTNPSNSIDLEGDFSILRTD